MQERNQHLWRRIEAFDLDDGNAAYPFSARLAKENGWSREFASRVIEEYKRFVFICLTAEHVACPSEEVDQAWHLHLTYTRSYWDRFCKDALGRPLHHEPTKGGGEERSKHWQMYERTIASYRTFFGKEPPADIWPSAALRFSAQRMERVDLGQYWLVPRWPFNWLIERMARVSTRVATPTTASTVAAVGLPLMLANLNPLDLRGPEFLLLMAICWGAIVLLRLVLGFTLLNGGSERKEELDPYEAALLSGDSKTAVLAAVGSLSRAEAIEVKPNSAHVYTIKGPPPEAAHPLQKSVYSVIKGGVDYSTQLFSATKDDTDKIEARLIDDRLLNRPETAGLVRAVPAFLMFSLLVLALAKIGVGVSRHKPIEFLIFVCVGIFLSLLVLLAKPRLTWAGRKLLAEQRKKYERLRATSSSPQGQQAPTSAEIAPFDVAMAMGLFGVMALPAVSELDPMRHLLRQNPPPGGWTDGSSGGTSGCGGSGCGGSGCGGGGCGGGGCGGCGGCGGG